MSTASIRASKTAPRKSSARGKHRGKTSAQLVKATNQSVVYRHPAAFGAAARKYAGIVSSGVGNLSTREGFDD